ncbi:MAG: leucine-rich repeat domain-containing protein [Candidatus Pseudoruminococcus sp.]|nr:leucine-rich repeat domain-containing protein [Ruminococcus sp.]MDY2783783.1 leucine-rich repeat domain-containing protein [Candidatus Pseudoruminococcus sp.]
MKKIMISLLTVIMTMSICACGNDTNTSSKESTAKSSASASNDSSNKKELIYDSTEDFDYSEVDDGVIITYFNNHDYVEYNKIIVPSEIDGKKVVGIGDDKRDYYVFGAVFGNCEVVIPDTVTYIGDYAFTGAKGLVKLSGGENCKKIGEYTFMNCVNLAEVTFLDNVTDLADNAFAGCTKWKSLH